MSVSSNKLLLKLVSSADSSRFTLICDHLECISKQLIKCLINNRLKQSFNIIVIIVENDVNKYLTDIDVNSCKQYSNNFQIFDYFTKYDSIETNISSHIMNSLSSVSSESIVIIDSLTPLLISDSLPQICCLLNELRHRFKQLISVLHIDSHSELTNTSIERMADSVIDLNRNDDKSVVKALITYRKPHRKTHYSVQQSIEWFVIKDMSIHYVNHSKTSQPLTTTTTDPTLNLPFNLNLKDDEIIAKNSLSLPYVKTHKESKIYYEFDKNDDIDEEDPDEDLDI